MITDLYLDFQDLLFYIIIRNFSPYSKVSAHFFMGISVLLILLLAGDIMQKACNALWFVVSTF